MEPYVEPRQRTARPAVLGGLAVVLVLVLGAGARLAHTTTIPNVGLPASNSKTLDVSAYDAQVGVTKQYLLDLASLNYRAAYQRLAPSVRQGLSEAQFTADRKQEGVLGQPVVWADDETSSRAEYALGRADGGNETRRHRFFLKNEGGQWWIGQEMPLASDLPVAPSLSAAMNRFVQQRAGKIWTGTIELLRQEAFEGGQLLLFSYIEPDPAGILTAERIATLNYYTDASDGWHFEGGGTTGLPAGMSVADAAMGFTAFGS